MGRAGDRAIDTAGQFRCLHCGDVPNRQWITEHDPNRPCNVCHETAWTYDTHQEGRQ